MASPKKLPSQKVKPVPEIERRIEVACKRHSNKAVEILANALTNPAVDIRWKISAAKEILDRAWGRPAQQIKADVSVSSVDALIEVLKNNK